MNIGYDVSVLGVSYFNQRARTGIFRVIDELLMHLIKDNDINLRSISFRTYFEAAASSFYIDSLNGIENCTFIAPSSYSYFIYKAEKELIQKNQKYLSDQTLPGKIFRRSLTLPIEKILPIQVDFQSIDLFHFPFFVTGDLSQTLGKPCIFTVYDLIPIKFPQYFRYKETYQLKRMLAQIQKERDFVTCISESTKKDFCEFTSMDPARVYVTPLSASDLFFPVQNNELIVDTLKEFSIPNEPYILSLATLEPRKNLDFLIHGFINYIKQSGDKHTNLILVGTLGWKYGAISNSLATIESTLRERIFFTGYVPDEVLSSIYSGASVFVYPSLYEGFGLPPLEAMKCGTPIISSNTSSLPEVVGDAGILIDPTQEDELCQALTKVLGNSQFRDELSKKSLDRASQFSWQRCAEQTIQVYRTALN